MLFGKVGSSVKSEEADYSLESIHNVREAIPEIWKETTKYMGHDRDDNFDFSIVNVNSIEETPIEG